MSRPYQFSQDHRSPLDRRPQGGPSGPPPSFNTNVNRAKTKKWVEAKTVSYDGDDWGDYDEIDEYGASAPPPMPPQATPISSIQSAGPGRNFTDPRPGGASQLTRKNSFDTGDERRAFSGPQPPQQPRIDTRGAQIPQHIRNEGNVTQSPSTMSPSSVYSTNTYQSQPRAGQQPSGNHRGDHTSRQSSGASWNQSVMSETPSVNIDPQERRDFNPSAMPQPLSTRGGSAGPATVPYTSHPPRKSSLGQDDAPKVPIMIPGTGPVAQRERQSSESSTQPTIIRPADIYKRMAEAREKERASSESSRPSTESQSVRSNAVETRSMAPVSEVSEPTPESHTRAVNLLAQMTAPPKPGSITALPSSKSQSKRLSTSPELPQFTASSSFGDEFWSNSGFAHQQEVNDAQASQPPHQTTVDTGLQDLVDQAFTRKDDKSVPPTPISRQPGSTSDTGSGVSRSNTDSTSGISPIMSRVPSSAAAAVRARAAEEKDMATPAIAEESPNASRRASAAIHGLEQVPRRPDQASRSRTASGSSIPKRRSLASPDPTESPARSPKIRATTNVPEASVAELDVASPLQTGVAITKIASPPEDFTIREADLAKAVSTSPDKDIAQLAAKEKESQIAFLEHSKDFGAFPQSKVSTPRDRSESPTKSRVRDLAGRFGEVSDSRRSSIQSINSRKSIASGTKDDQLHSPAESAERPVAKREESFRPKLPGQWESFVTTPGVETPNEEKRLQEPHTTDDEPIDLEPTTPRRSATLKGPGVTAGDAMAALAAAGSAMGESIKAAAGFGGSTSPNEQHSRSTGDIYSRPTGPDRVESATTTTTVAPTPPPKENVDDDDDDNDSGGWSDNSDDVRPVPPLKSREGTPLGSIPPHIDTSVEAPEMPHLSVNASPQDQESDRLRKEIVQSLSPVASESPEAARALKQIASPTESVSHDNSSLPAEYDTFWPGSGTDGTDTYPFRDLSSDAASTNVVGSAAPPEKPLESLSASGPGHLDRRFSWEKPNTAQVSQTDFAPQPSSTVPRAEASAALPASSPQGLAVNRGLHVLNTATPEAVELPSFGVQSVDLNEGSKAQQNPAVSSAPQLSTNSPAVTTSFPVVTHAPGADSERIPPFREILVLKSAAERTQKYESARQQFANMDSGLRNWLSVTFAHRPEHADVRDIAIRPIAPQSAGTIARHRHTPSINVFSKLNQQSVSNSPSSPVVQQSSSATDKAPGSSSGGGKVQARGKEFFHSAGILGGKATIGAKGLFAKGKSRFKGGNGDKVE